MDPTIESVHRAIANGLYSNFTYINNGISGLFARYFNSTDVDLYLWHISEFGFPSYLYLSIREGIRQKK